MSLTDNAVNLRRMAAIPGGDYVKLSRKTALEIADQLDRVSTPPSNGVVTVTEEMMERAAAELRDRADTCDRLCGPPEIMRNCRCKTAARAALTAALSPEQKA